MSSLRKLSAIYIAAASAYAVAIACSHDPSLAVNARVAGAETVRLGGEAAIALNTQVVQPGWAMARMEAADLSRRIAEAMQPAPVAQTIVAVKPKPKPAATAVHSRKPSAVIAKVMPHPPRVIAPALRPTIIERPQVATAAPSAEPRPRVELQLAPQPPAPLANEENLPPALPAAAGNAPSPAELARVSDRLRDSLTSEMLANFDLFLYVSKASSGPLAQRIYVFDKQPGGNLVLLYNWPVSTGREKIEYNEAGLRLPSYTPSGYYELDPKRFYPNYHSIQWNQQMPYAMFFNWVKDGDKTGLAIHGASGEDIGLLGMRASAGCIRIAPENARMLFTLIREHYRGTVPRFDFDKRTATMSNNGLLLHDDNGQLEFADGYKVLVFVEDFGGENVVAALF